MAEALISIVGERVAEIIQDRIRYEVNLLRGVENKVQDLSDKLQTIKDVLDDAEKRGPKEQSVKQWLKKLEDTAYEMEDILDEWKYRMEDPAAVSAEVCCSFIPSSRFCFKKLADRRQTAKKIQNVKASLDRILKEKDDFNFVISLPSTHPVPIPGRVQSSSSIDLDKVYGRDEDRNNMVRKLMVNDDRQIMCIVGMGGIGKTTLAQLVYNDTQVKGCFQKTIWICVSDPFDVAGIARGIIEKVTNEIIPANTNVQLDFVLEKLRDCISGNKFLLVLDDVWTEDYNKWEPLKINLGYGAPSSKILVTTRNEGVARMMMRGNADVEIYRPQKLTDEECWKLLRGASLPGMSEEECREFEDVGKKIARKCEGLPLAAKVLGSHLLFKNSLEEWENVLESEIWQMEEAKVELFPHLLLSYNELSPTLKRCFSHCAVYPKDYLINAKELMEEWRALGYLGSVSGNGGVEHTGRDYLNNLAMRYLFQDIKKSGEDIEWCKMHDIVHDFAQFLRKNNDTAVVAGMTERSCQVCNPSLLSQAQEYRSLVWDRESPISICDCVAIVRVFRLGCEPWARTIDGPLLGMEKLIHLRWLKLNNIKLSKEDINIICRLYFLRTMLLISCSLEEIPSEIGNLVNLRHLDLSCNEELKPESICCLVELQILDLGGCRLERLPGEIGNLVELRHLNLCSCTELKELPESLCSLVELEILNIVECYNLSTLPEGIHRLKNLQHLILDHQRTPVSNHLPQGVGQLSGLRTFGDAFFGGRSGCTKLGLLKDLNRLTGSLDLGIKFSSISDLEELVGDAREAELRNKVHIQSLELQFYGEMDETERSSPLSSSLLVDVIEALEPHRKLENLGIWFYDGSRLPRWISSPDNFVKQIDLVCLSEVSSLPPMGKLPFLEILFMEGLDKLKLVGREFLGIECSSSSSSSSSSSTSNEVVVFPKLKELTFEVGDQWEEWEDITADEEESTAVSIMPCLTQLRIHNCWGLKKLPHRLLRKASSSSEFLNIDTFHVGSGFDKLGLLKNLNLDTGSSPKLKIHLSSMSDVEELVEDAWELRNVINIHGVHMSFICDGYEKEWSSPSSSSLWMKIIESLEPNLKLTYLGIRGYKGSRLPHWISLPHNFIKQIHLDDLSEISSLPPMGKLPFLEVLRIQRLDKLKKVGREFLGIECSSSSSSTVAFPKLEQLTFDCCDKWEEWEDITAEEEESVDVSIMPCLTMLNIKSCKGLKKLPHRLLRKVSSSLEFLHISYSPELQKSYGGEDGSPYLDLPCHALP